MCWSCARPFTACQLSNCLPHCRWSFVPCSMAHADTILTNCWRRSQLTHYTILGVTDNDCGETRLETFEYPRRETQFIKYDILWIKWMLEELCQSVHESASFLGERSRANEIVLCLRHRIDLVVTHYYLVGLSPHPWVYFVGIPRGDGAHPCSSLDRPEYPVIIMLEQRNLFTIVCRSGYEIGLQSVCSVLFYLYLKLWR